MINWDKMERDLASMKDFKKNVTKTNEFVTLRISYKKSLYKIFEVYERNKKRFVYFNGGEFTEDERGYFCRVWGKHKQILINERKNSKTSEKQG